MDVELSVKKFSVLEFSFMFSNDRVFPIGRKPPLRELQELEKATKLP